MSSGRFSEITRASSCRRPDTVTSTDARQYNSFYKGQQLSMTAGKDRLHCWYSTFRAGEKSGLQDEWSSNHKGRWATRQVDWRIRNMTDTSRKEVGIVHRNEERKELVFDNSQMDNKYAIQDHERHNLKLPQKRQTCAQPDQVFQSRTPVQHGRPFQIVYDKKIKTLMSVYMNKSDKSQRHERLLNKIEEIQISEAKMEHAQTIQKQEARKISWKRQVDSIRKVRQRFDEEQTARFQTQFVSWKSVEKYRYNKSNNGLPDVLPTLHSEEGASIDHRPPVRPIERETLRTRNKKRYRTILEPSINNRRKITSVIRTHVKEKPDRRNTLVLSEAQEVLFNTEIDFSQMDDLSEQTESSAGT